MPLQKQAVPINFSQGLDTKTDPYQVPAGKFLLLENSVFNKGGLLTKRNGFEPLSSLPALTYKYLTTFMNNLLAVGPNLSAYAASSKSWVNKGSILPMQLSTQTLIRTSSNQSQVDTAISGGLICTVYANSSPSVTYNYAVSDTATGQNIVAPTVIATPGESPRVFVLGNYFIVLFSQSTNLRYIAIPINNPSAPLAAVTLVTNYLIGNAQLAFDGVVANNNLYVSYNATDGGGDVRMTFMNSFLVRQTSATGSSVAVGKVAAFVSVCADTTHTSPIIWTTFYVTSSTSSYNLAVDQQLTTVLAVQLATNTDTIVNIATSAQNSVLTYFYEDSGAYNYGASLPTNRILKKTIAQAGSPIVSSGNIALSVGLASKSFILDNKIYVLAAYSSAYQPSYFLLNDSGNVISRLAYSNGGGYLTAGLPSVSVSGSIARVGYLIRDLIQAANKSQNPTSTTPVYTQTGINLASFDFTTDGMNSSEIGGNLQITGGLLWAYDGYQTVEQGFNLYPDNVVITTATTTGGLKSQQYYYQVVYEWTDNQGNIHRSAPSLAVSENLTGVAPTGVTFTSVFSSGANSITVSSAANLFVGQTLTDSTTAGNITAGTTITSISGTAIGLSLPTAGGSAVSPGDTLKTVDTNKNTINVPTLRLTYKSLVKIVLYRWSLAQQTYYQATSITSPILNDKTTDSIAIVDSLNDAAIVGNSILYTTGGVVENISPPATNTMTLFKSRLFLVDAEDANLLWYSKQVIEATPVEMSDLFTIYVAPTVSAQGNTGPITALSAMDDKLIIFKKDAIYYLVGIGPDNTGANNDFSDPVFVTSTVGCIDQNSIVFMPQGLMFKSDKGIWLLGRDLSTTYIGAPVEEFNASEVLSALSIPGTNQVRFTLNSGEVLMYDYYYQQWGSFSGIPGISSTLYEGLHSFIDSFGMVFQESLGLYLDGSSPVLMKFTTSWFNLAGLQGYERAYCFYLLATYLSPHKLNVQTAYDYNASAVQSSLVVPDNFSPAYGRDSVFGGASTFAGPSNIEQWRVDLQQQKCQAFQITITEIFDASFGVMAGAGLSISGLNLIVGAKRGYPRLKPSVTVG